ncbi:class I SAM-dependent methyltransferase [Rhodoferax sp.]|uniref:class I SAM-dependent methyltransferase n=1 Tax=Rhodoferax sp. TaxID=50421 RepID=UPI00374DC606
MRLPWPLPWPLPALLAWGGAWALFVLLQQLALSGVAALVLATAAGAACSLLGASWWRRGLIAAGFPLSLALSGTVALPAWAWLLPLALLLLVYPLNAWRDAPLFPTPVRALQDLAAAAPLPAEALVLDAGCGLGDGLLALRLAYPQARLQGLEWSWLLRALCGLRCPWARVRQGDIWQADWSGYALVYLFQRPESMARALAKAQAQMAPGSWLVSLEFEVAGVEPTTRLEAPDGRPVWLYRVGRPP